MSIKRHSLRFTASLILLGAVSATAAPSSDVEKHLAVAEHLAAAAELQHELEYERALAQVQQAKAAARTDEDRKMVHLWEGILAADLGKRELADDAFLSALVIDRDAELPTKVSPKVREQFEALRSTLPPPTPLTVSDRPDRLALTPGASSPATSALKPLPNAHRHLWVPIAFGGAALAAGAGATVFGLQAAHHNEAARGAVYQGDAAVSLRQAQQNAVVANVLLATAGTALVGGVVSYVLGMPVASAPARIP